MASVNLDIAQRLDITCRKGDTFQLELDFGQDMDGTWLMEVLESDNVDGDSLIPFDVTVSDGEATSSKVTITALASDVNISGVYVYDLQKTSPSNVTTYLYGIFKVNEDVSQ